MSTFAIKSELSKKLKVSKLDIQIKRLGLKVSDSKVPSSVQIFLSFILGLKLKLFFIVKFHSENSDLNKICCENDVRHFHVIFLSLTQNVKIVIFQF